MDSFERVTQLARRNTQLLREVRQAGAGPLRSRWKRRPRPPRGPSAGGAGRSPLGAVVVELLLPPPPPFGAATAIEPTIPSARTAITAAHLQNFNSDFIVNSSLVVVSRPSLAGSGEKLR